MQFSRNVQADSTLELRRDGNEEQRQTKGNGFIMLEDIKPRGGSSTMAEQRSLNVKKLIIRVEAAKAAKTNTTANEISIKFKSGRGPPYIANRQLS